MKKIYAFLFCATFASGAVNVFAQQTYDGWDANNICKGSVVVSYNKDSKVPSFISFGESSSIKTEEIMGVFSSVLHFRNEDQLVQYRQEDDKAGFTHTRYQQFYKGVRVENGQYVAHEKGGMLFSLNGFFVEDVNMNVVPSISGEQAIQIAIQDCGALHYRWQDAILEARLKENSNDPYATYYPKAELTIVAKNFDYKIHDLHLCYKMDIFAVQPMSRNVVYVDASTGEIVAKENEICSVNTNGTGNTMYDGVKPLKIDSFALNNYRLRETTRGLGVETYDLNTSVNYATAVDFTNNTNFFNVSTNYDRAAYEAHWAAENTYDYYQQVFGRNSLDNAGMKIISMVHYDVNFNDAFWNGSEISYGDGNHLVGGCNTFPAIDIGGHELTHGVTRLTAALLYVNESGALNESFSDIMGTNVEFHSTTAVPDWTIGEDVVVNAGTAFRSMSNPNLYGQPDTYLGTNWYIGFNDNGGVHKNSGVQNFWYYLLCQGGVGVNDIGNNFNVTGIGRAHAEQIVYRNLTMYMTSFSNYFDARRNSIQAAQDLYGACSPEVIATTNAWYAVGVGPAYSSTISAQFSVSGTTACSVPFTVNFSNTSTNATNVMWYFGDNTSSNVYSPTHTYTIPGTYSVKLVCSSSCGASDSLIQSSLITITTPTAPTTTGASACGPAAVNLSATGNGTLEWYTNSSGGNPIHSGANYLTPVLPSTTTYYVESQIAGNAGFCGKLDSSGVGGPWGGFSEQEMIFDVYQAATLKTVNVYSTVAGTRNVTLRNSAGTYLQSCTVNLPVGPATINLNFPLTPGTGYRLGGDTLNFTMNIGNVSFPYTLNGVASIINSSVSSSSTPLYLFFYNWQFETAPCVSLRTPVIATINTPPVVSYNDAPYDSLCVFGNPVTLTGGSPAGGTYSGTAVSGGVFNPLTSGVGNFTITYSYTDVNGCSGTSTQNIFVDICTGINSGTVQTGMSVSPNPSNGNITIELGLLKNDETQISIVNSLGETIRTEVQNLSAGNNKVELDLKSLAKGIYFIQVKTSTDVLTKRILLN